MVNEYVSQGGAFHVIDDSVELLRALLESRGIKYNIENNICTLSSKIVGIISLPDKRIVLTPRHEGITISHIIRMYFFVNNYLSGSNDIDDAYDISGSDKYLDISKVFLKELTRVIKIGLPIDYSRVQEDSAYYKGRVNTIKTQQNILRKKLKPVATSYSVLSHEIDVNYILSGALSKVRSRIPGSEINYYESQLPYSNPELAKILVDNCTLNRKYSYCRSAINYAIMILQDYSYESFTGQYQGEVFLVDYDNLFESFVWAVIRTFSNDHLYARWEKTQPYGEYVLGGKSHNKGYEPDILYGQIRQDPPKYKSVLDVKNKMPNIFSNADIYQMYFYITLLEAENGILIYPGSESMSQTSFSFYHALLKTLKVDAISLNITAKTAKGFHSDLKDFCGHLHTSIYS